MKHRTEVILRQPGEATAFCAQCPFKHRPSGSAEPPLSQSPVVVAELAQRPLGSIDIPLSQNPAVVAWPPSRPFGSRLAPFLFHKLVRAIQICSQTPCVWTTVGPERWAARLRDPAAEAQGLRRVHPRTRAAAVRRNDGLNMRAAPFAEAAHATAFRAGLASLRAYGAATVG
jgi:hypothetical protein